MDCASPQVDTYTDANGVLKNLIGVKEEATLTAVEGELAFIRQTELMAAPPRITDMTLPGIHRHLFQDVYAWAGQYRTINMQKGSVMFCHHPLIGQNIEKIMRNLSAEKYLAGLNAQKFSERAAYFLGEINMVHPFREGNGRTQRLFLSFLAQQAGHTLTWSHVAEQEMINASIASAQTADNTRFASIIFRGISNQH